MLTFTMGKPQYEYLYNHKKQVKLNPACPALGTSTDIIPSEWIGGSNETLKTLVHAVLQIIVCIGKLFSLFLIQNICFGYSKESSQGDGSFEHPKHMLKLMGKKMIKILRK